ncbi:conserved hypothetical protein [Heliomicrobium modesticaldum Ice1]|uniref:FAD-dependent protein C-terminal domain-containing protein n=1 Tax=Heliobacterium modesticaldum (strain ATCC 51547 / Ice1) TaxID=498761 RepID=B0TCS0_HELMI|nr:hypothetical protein [Heliomicrobium modesticaldum]ABZ84096.1 conserved hypothetical protein [Heliomicrobium modesticaldum Ice1]
MKIRIANLRAGLSEDAGRLLPKAARRIGLKPGQIENMEILREAVDARKKADIRFVYTVEVTLKAGVKPPPGILDKDPQVSLVAENKATPLLRGSEPLTRRPVIVGAGPCGYFAALKLAEAGFKPILLERGYDVDRRAADVDRFWETGKLRADSNVQFGEGGAGTFSDGKLTTRTHDWRINEVFRRLAEAGAPQEILYKAKPHVGTDVLRQVVRNLRQRLLEQGGQVFFGACVEELILEKTALGRRVAGVRLAPGVDLMDRGSAEDLPLSGTARSGLELAADVVIVAIGHSARDTAKNLYDQEIAMEAKPFAVGLRVEHPQALIDRAQYGRFAGHERLGVADYNLHTKLAEAGRTVFSFCMCPGGQVVAAASEAGGVVTNGMSAYARDSGVANSALVVSVSPGDYPVPGPLGGAEFQRIWERKAFELGEGDYRAPAQTVGDFLADQKGDLSDSLVKPTYRPGVTAANLRDGLPKAVGEALAAGLADFGRKIQGFDLPKAVLTGVETRTSSPWRINRDESLQSPGIKGLYPGGEGAGYAGGIVSAAVDGLRLAEAIIATYRL